MKCNYTWSDMEDTDIYKNGITVAYISGKAKAIQNFVEKASYEICHKVDFAYSGGIAHIDVLPDGVEKLVNLFNNKEFMKDFIISYDDNPEYYFQIMKLLK